MGGSNIAQAATNWFWINPIYRNTRNEASQLSIICDNKGRSRINSRKNDFFDQTTQLLAAHYYVATIRGRRLFHCKARRHQWRLTRYIRVIQRWLLDAAIVHITSQFCCQPWKSVVGVKERAQGYPYFLGKDGELVDGHVHIWEWYQQQLQ